MIQDQEIIPDDMLPKKYNQNMQKYRSPFIMAGDLCPSKSHIVASAIKPQKIAKSTPVNNSYPAKQLTRSDLMMSSQKKNEN